MPQLGDTCRQPGVYQCDSCSTTVTVRSGQRFPPCARERLKAVNWTLVAVDAEPRAEARTATRVRWA
jgi:hypothetical protein